MSKELSTSTRSRGTILMLDPCNYSDPVVEIIRSAGYEEFEFEVPCDGIKPGFIKYK
ncbi:MAG: hypothetical protein ACYC27_08380 [Armatimonadota bacterium]